MGGVVPEFRAGSGWVTGSGWVRLGDCQAVSGCAPVPAQDTLTEISEWLESHPREVVILACRNFEGMTQDLHEYLVTCIKNIFGDMLCPRGVRRAG